MGTPTLAQVIQDAVEARLAGLHTMLPGKVVRVNVAAGKCDVQPLIKRVNADGIAVALPVITNCPIGFYRAGKAAVYLPLAVGHYVEIRFCERSLDTWLSKGGTVDPEDRRKHNLSDAVVYPGLYPLTDAPAGADPTKLVLKNDKAEITLAPNGVIWIRNENGTPSEPIVLGETLKEFLSNTIDEITAAIQAIVTGPIGLGNLGGPVPTDAALASTLSDNKAALEEFKTTYLETAETNILSQIGFTERGGP